MAFSQHLAGLHIRVLGKAEKVLHPAQHIVVCLKTLCVSGKKDPLLRQGGLEIESRHDSSYDFILQREHILQGLVISLHSSAPVVASAN
jgi:hypothetical protein